MTYTQEQADRWDKLTVEELGRQYRYTAGPRAGRLSKRQQELEQELANLRENWTTRVDEGEDIDVIRAEREALERELEKTKQQTAGQPKYLKQLQEYLRLRQKATFPRMESAAEETQPVSDRKLLQIPTGSGTITFTGEGRKSLRIGGM